jgi:hypothetical protein
LPWYQLCWGQNKLERLSLAELNRLVYNLPLPDRIKMPHSGTNIPAHFVLPPVMFGQSKLKCLTLTTKVQFSLTFNATRMEHIMSPHLVMLGTE